MGDTLTPKQRSYCMSRVKGKDTGIEKTVRSELQKRGLRFRKHTAKLPGKPDIVFLNKKIAVFLDGDFWHGYRFPQWQRKLKPFWKNKILETRKRDRRNFAKLKRDGWNVIRIWEHEIKHDLEKTINRITNKFD
jgi:DNA mismatch endonuclease (patch repair protein)